MHLSSSAFIPTVNAITSNQELQWMIQPAVLAPSSGPLPPTHPYSAHSPGQHTGSGPSRPGVIQMTGNVHWRNRKNVQCPQLTAEEEEKKRLRRERNKLAAAKCRNRRRELTEQLQGETERLEQEQANLCKQVETLQEERTRLEQLLESHASICSLTGDKPPPSVSPYSPIPSTAIKQEPQDDLLFPPLSKPCTVRSSVYESNVKTCRLGGTEMSAYSNCPTFSYSDTVQKEVHSKGLQSKDFFTHTDPSLEPQSMDLLNSPTLLTL